MSPPKPAYSESSTHKPYLTAEQSGVFNLKLEAELTYLKSELCEI